MALATFYYFPNNDYAFVCFGKKFLRQIPFLPQPSPFIWAWDRHQKTQKCASDSWVSETVAVTKKQVEEMEVAEIKMLRFAME